MALFGIEATYAIMGSAALFSVLANAANRVTGVKKKNAQLKKRVEDYQKEYKAAAEKKDEKKLEELKKREGEMLGAMQEMMFQPLKAMVIVLPLFFLFTWVIDTNYAGFTARLPIGIHLSEILSLNVFAESTYGPRGFFIFFSIISGLIVETVAGRLLRD